MVQAGVLPDPVLMADPACVSEAVVCWTGWKHRSWPHRDERAVVEHFGEDAALDLLPIVKMLEDAGAGTGVVLHLRLQVTPVIAPNRLRSVQSGDPRPVQPRCRASPEELVHRSLGPAEGRKRGLRRGSSSRALGLGNLGMRSFHASHGASLQSVIGYPSAPVGRK